MQTAEERWAEEEFGHASLGDARRTARLVRLAQRAAQRPSGCLTKVFHDSAEREAAYRLAERGHVTPEALGAAAHVAALRRAEADSVVYVPVDGTSLSLPRTPAAAPFGSVGNSASAARGAQVMSALALSQAGVPLGPCGQVFWVRRQLRRRPRAHFDGVRQRLGRGRPVGRKETAFWGDVLEQVLAARRAVQPRVRLWFQLDRGADFYELLCSLPLLDDWVTLRAAQNRTVLWEDKQLLRQVVRTWPLLGSYALHVSEGPQRTARTARMEVRASRVVLSVKSYASGGAVPVPFTVVWAREASPVPQGQKPLDWLLLTTRPGHTFQDARQVIAGYALRWRIEEVHKAWKSLAEVEKSGAHGLHAFSVWASVLFSVATRIERLKYLSRTSPDSPASVELTDDEIRALLVLRARRAPSQPNYQPTIAEAVRWIAEQGGYTGKSSGGPPGTITIGRGLERLKAATDFLRLLDHEKM
jgi:hypothetical protein